MSYTVFRTPLGVFLYGPYASRPSATTVVEGTIYWPTDDTRAAVSLGGSWRETAASGGGGGGTLTATTELYEVDSLTLVFGSTNQLVWVNGSATLLDLTDPSTPKYAADGIYSIAAALFLDSTYPGKVGSFRLDSTTNGGILDQFAGQPAPLDFSVDVQGLTANLPPISAVGGTDVIVALFDQNTGGDISGNFLAAVTKLTVT